VPVEPVASLDPLARREFLQSVMEAVAESGMTVLLSSHIVADLERVCDHLVILAHGRPQLAGSIDGILAGHRLLTSTRTDPAVEHPLTATWSARRNGPDLSRAWVLFQRPSDRLGRTLPPSVLFQKCPGPLQEKLAKLAYGCPGHKGGIYTHAVFQPARRFWAFQGIETALFGGIAAVLILFPA
jgi:hypothetical protein